MKKCFTLLTISIALILNATADSGGPDSWGYTWKDSNEPGGPVYNWIDITGENAIEVKLLQDDNIRGPFQLNFDFHYYWYDVSQFWVGSNGYISFQYGNLASPFPTSPSNAAPNDLIGGFMNDLTFAGTNDSAACYYWISQDYDSLIVSYVNVPYFDINANGQSGNNTFQIILSAVDSSITFQYKDVTPTNPVNFAYSVVGLENYSGSLGLFWDGLPFQSPPENYAIKYYAPKNPTLVIEDAYMYYNDNPETGAIFIPGNSGVPHDLHAVIKNGGNTTLNPFNIQGMVKDPNNVQVVSEFFLTDTLDSWEDQSFSFTQQLNPSIYGTYRFTTLSQLVGDDVNGNNTKTQELVVVDTTQTEIVLGYDNNEFNLFSVNWVGDEGGVGNHFIPPFYPCQVTKLHYFVTFNPGVAMSGRIFDDDGIGGLPFTLYDSIYLNSSQIVNNGWTDIVLTDPVVVTSGGFYVSWDMQGEGITLGNTGQPVSNRSFEVFENGWGVYRYRADYDPMIRVTIENYSFPTAVNDPEKELQFKVFPNPAKDIVTIAYESLTNQNVWLAITDLQGKLISRINLGKANPGTNQFTIDASNFASGMYLMKLYSGISEKMEKLVVAD